MVDPPRENIGFAGVAWVAGAPAGVLEAVLLPNRPPAAAGAGVVDAPAAAF